jgi:hypothetical protein
MKFFLKAVSRQITPIMMRMPERILMKIEVGKANNIY